MHRADVMARETHPTRLKKSCEYSYKLAYIYKAHPPHFHMVFYKMRCLH